MREKSHRYNEYTQETYDVMYSQNWSAFAQSERDDATIEMGLRFVGITSIADLSAGGSRITPTLAASFGAQPILGDYWDGYGYQYSGDLVRTVPHIEPVDLFVCTETLEHLYEPDAALHAIRPKTKYMLLTTPVAERPELVSHGHLWAWDREGVEEMLSVAGFSVIEFEQVSIFGLWRCG